MTRIWEFSDTKSMPHDLVREQDFILRIRRLQRLATPYLVTNLILTALEPLAKSRKALEAVESRLKEFAKVTNGIYAEMSNGDAFMMWEESADSELLLQRLKAVILPDGNADHVLQIYHLPADYTPLRERANAYVEMVQASQASSPTSPTEALHSEAARGPLTAWGLDQIERLIADIDLQPYLKAQNIYRYESNGAWTPVRTEYYLSIEDLRRDRFPKLNIHTPEHLFLALCEILDEKLLKQFIAKPELIKGRAININLSVAAIMSSTFAQFAHAIPHADRGRIAFELHRGDLLQDFARTLGAIETLKHEGFQVALDSITPDMVGYVNLAAFKADYIKLNVAKDRAVMMDSPALRQGLAHIAPGQIICFRCDSEQALKTAQAMGIGLFQGWLLDEKMKK